MSKAAINWQDDATRTRSKIYSVPFLLGVRHRVRKQSAAFSLFSDRASSAQELFADCFRWFPSVTDRLIAFKPPAFIPEEKIRSFFM